MEGSSFNPLFIILKENKLIGPNYINWKRNLNLVLTAEEYKFILTDVCPPLCPIYYNTSMRTWPLLMT